MRRARGDEEGGEEVAVEVASSACSFVRVDVLLFLSFFFSLSSSSSSSFFFFPFFFFFLFFFFLFFFFFFFFFLLLLLLLLLLPLPLPLPLPLLSLLSPLIMTTSPCVDPPPRVPDPSWSRLQSQQKPCKLGILSETWVPLPVVAQPHVGFDERDPASHVREGQPVPVLTTASLTP